jgi:hypothetical protein
MERSNELADVRNSRQALDASDLPNRLIQRLL